MSGLKPSFEQRFWANVKKTRSCWLWTACTCTGYGVIVNNGKQIKAHRWSYEHHIGPIPVRMFVCHKCDNPPCVNPDHLFVGTALDNKRDEMTKGRSRAPTGQFFSLTHCIRGHEFTPENTAPRPVGNKMFRACRECRRMRWRTPEQKIKNRLKMCRLRKKWRAERSAA